MVSTRRRKDGEEGRSERVISTTRASPSSNRIETKPIQPVGPSHRDRSPIIPVSWTQIRVLRRRPLFPSLSTLSPPKPSWPTWPNTFPAWPTLPRAPPLPANREFRSGLSFVVSLVAVIVTWQTVWWLTTTLVVELSRAWGRFQDATVGPRGDVRVAWGGVGVRTAAARAGERELAEAVAEADEVLRDLWRTTRTVLLNRLWLCGTQWVDAGLAGMTWMGQVGEAFVTTLRHGPGVVGVVVREMVVVMVRVIAAAVDVVGRWLVHVLGDGGGEGESGGGGDGGFINPPTSRFGVRSDGLMDSP